MAYTGKPRKINVRSPYFVTVAKAPSKVVETDIDPTEGEDPAVPITVPIVRTEDFDCGSTKNVNGSVGYIKFNIDITGKTVAEHSVAFSGVKVPIKYRLGFAGNMPSFSTAGLDTYADQWEEATTETPTLTATTEANLLSGISFNATFTPTQNDIDTYGNTILLEIAQPVPTESYSLVANCAANASVPAAPTTNSVVVISVSGSFGLNNAIAKLTVNGTELDTDAVYKGSNLYEPTNRYITDTTTYLPVNGDASTNRSNAQFLSTFETENMGTTSRRYFKVDFSGFDSAVQYLSPSTLNSNTNTLTLEMTSSGESFQEFPFVVTISKHRIDSSNNTILGCADGEDIPALLVKHVFRGRGSTFSMNFLGSNEKDLEGIFAQLETPKLEERGIRPIENVTIQKVKYKAL